MQNVLADLALEWEAATLLALRLARAFDAGKEDERERQFARIVTPVAKYWVCKRINALAVEAMECLGGSGYVEESPLARLYREAPVNGIWEGSGNVISLDVLRSIAREPASVDAFFAELADAASDEPKLARVAEALRSELADTATLEVRARRVVEEMAVALQAALMVRHAPSAVAGAFIATRLEGDWGACFGTLPAGTDCAAILGRVRANG
jgi:putative acyl-CoA dehydrogenase